MRIEKQRAEDLFHLIGQSGYGEVERHMHNGKFMRDEYGNIRTMMNYRTVIIVE